jgi:hypothetical protein
VLVALAPMFAVIGPAPGLESEAEYAYETLWNGVRVIAHLPGNGSMRLLSQTGVDVTDQYPELKALPVPTVQLPYTSRRDLLDDLALAGPGISVPAAWPAPAEQALE